MDTSADRYEIDETDYDGRNGKRWYYRLYCDGAGVWFWEPRVPTPTEVAAPHALHGVSWEPTTLAEGEWPPRPMLGPFSQRGDAIVAAERWFDWRP